MDFFEKAHVSKRSPPKKDSKSEEMVKKQLKQMLHGYKKSDNDLIMSSGNAFSDIAEVHKALDDSTSVSGFSDLDLTKSDDEEDVTAAVSSEACDDNVSSSSDVNLSSVNSIEQSEDTNSQDLTDKIDLDSEERSGDYLEPISEGDEDIESLSQDIEPSENTSTSGDISLLEFEGSSSESESGSPSSEVFDPDGSLACKIMKKLAKSDNEDSPKRKKIKLDDPLITKSKKDTPKKKKKNKASKVQNKNYDNINMDSLNLDDSDEEDSVEHIIHISTQESTSTNASSPFISIAATEMSDQSLSDILGGYKHPTVKNLPCEKNNVVPTPNTSGIFVTDSEMQVEDVDSLIPEIGDDPVIEDIDIDLDATAESESQPNKENIDLFEDVEAKHKQEYVSPVKVYNAVGCCIFVMQHPAELFVNGKVKIKLLGGKVEVFGHDLKEEMNLYSPNNNFAQCLKTVAAENSYYGLFGQLTGVGLSVIEAEEIVTSLGEYDSVIKMSPLKDPKMDFVDENFSIEQFKRMKVDINAYRLDEASERLSCNIYLSRPSRSFEAYMEWDEAVGYGLKKGSRGIICGGKGVGKSTFIRYYVNRVLNNGPVLYIDLDPGQAEFTVAGCISATVVSTPLLGPNYTHLKTPKICFNIGMISSMDNTYRYASAVAKLIQECHIEFPSIPWIVNTMGMTNNIGLKFMVLVIIHVRPTFLLQIDSRVMKKRFESSLEPHMIRTLYDNFCYDRLFQRVDLPVDLDYNFITTRHNESRHRQDTSLSAKEERYLNFLGYFGQLMEIHSNFLGIVPYVVNLADLNIVTNVKVAKDAVLNVINGKIVALCQLATTDKGKVFTLQDNAPLCHGHGLVRGVDATSGLLYLVTPLATERLTAVNALVYADWAPELQGTERRLASGRPVPYRSPAHPRHKQHMAAPRRRFNPLQLLKMSRSA